MRCSLLILFASFLQAPGLAAEPPRSISQILALPPGEAAEALFGHVAPQIVAMNFDREVEGRPGWLDFATAPEYAGESGLCRARLIHVVLARSGGTAAELPVQQWQVDDVYKVIGEAQPIGPVTAAHRADQARVCAGAGPVLEAGRGGRPARGYFTYAGRGHPWMAVAALQGAIAAARSGTYGEIRCDQSYGDCTDPLGQLARLDLAELTQLEFAREGGTSRRYHLIATFGPATAAAEALPREISIALDVTALFHSPVSFAFERTELSAGYY